MGLFSRGLPAKKLTCSPLQALIGKVSVDVWAYRNSMVLNKLSKAARGKTNKAYDNTASFSKILTLKNLCQKYLIPKSLILLYLFKFNGKEVISNVFI